MPTSLLDILTERFGAHVDPDSDSGQILSALEPTAAFGLADLKGELNPGALTFAPTTSGVSLRAAKGDEAFVFTPPDSITRNFEIAQPPTGPEVRITLVSYRVPLPFFRPAKLGASGLLEEGPAGKVHLVLPDFILIVPANGAPHLGPSHDAAGALAVSVDPPFVFLASGTTLGFELETFELFLDPAAEVALKVAALKVFVNPPGVPALAMSGGGTGLILGLAAPNSGLSGDFTITAAGGAEAAARPHFLHNVEAELKLDRGNITLLELRGDIALKDAINEKFPATPLDDPAPTAIRYVLSLALEQHQWIARLALSSGGADFLWRSKGSGNIARDTSGAFAVFGPLLGGSLPDPGGTGLVSLGALVAGSAALAATHLVVTESITLFGGELIVRQAAGQPPQGFLFFDLEVALNVDAQPLIRTKRPIKVRHKGLGLELDFGANGASPFLRPVFNPDRGFGLDLSDPSMFELPDALANVLQPTGARAAKQNPLVLEVDLALQADLGVVTVDGTTVRVPLDGSSPPTITALGARVKVPEVIEGSGYLSILEKGFAGAIDVSLVPLKLRVAAALRVQPAGSETGVAVNLGVDFPIPLPLFNTGLGIFGFAGLFAMHFRRDQRPDQSALEWFEGHGGVADNILPGQGWEPEPHRWALGFGAVVGTLEGGFLAHAKGMIILELPGPGLLLVMKADLLSARPDVKKDERAKILAIIAITPDSLTIGILFEYNDLQPFLELRAPAELFFNFNDLSDWRLDIGSIPGTPGLGPVAVKFLFGLRAEGYLLIHGNGVEHFPATPDPIAIPGFAIAVGVRIAMVWGPEPIGLYLKIAAEVDVALGFNPFMLLGRLKVSGELHLFIISIEASAEAQLKIVGEDFFASLHVCGEVDFFFFSVEGCVTLRLGDTDPPLPKPANLLRAVSLHSRSPALLEGSGSDSAIDGSLGTAVEEGKLGPVPPIPIVPLDAIPVLQFEMRPVVPGGFEVMNTLVDPKLQPGTWCSRGNRKYRYTLRSITLSASRGGAPLSPAVSPGETPCVWWDRKLSPPPADGDQGKDHDVQLALLDWIPEPAPAAITRTGTDDTRITDRWGDLCQPIAQPAAVLCTVQRQALGPSLTGWILEGTAWPDAPDARRSAPPNRTLRVVEPWRSGKPVVDAARLVDPGVILGKKLTPQKLLLAPNTGDRLRPRIAEPRFKPIFDRLGPHDLAGLPDALRIGNDVTELRALLTLSRLLVETPGGVDLGIIVVRGLDGAGKPNGFERTLGGGFGKVINTIADLPSRWGNPTGPWAATMAGVLANAPDLSHSEGKRGVFVFFDLKEGLLPSGTHEVEIGLRSSDGFATPHWGLLVVEAVTAAEVERSQFDHQTRDHEIKAIDGALTANQGDRALLLPGANYTIEVTYDVEFDPNEKGEAGQTGIVEGITQRFHFQTSATPPARLDPWILTSHPGPGEQFFFWGDPVRLIFSTNAVRPLLDQYKAQLFAHIYASSGNHPPSAPGFDPERVAVFNTVKTITSPTTEVYSPWEAAVRDLFTTDLKVPEGGTKQFDCVNITGESPRHLLVDFTFMLTPLTDYVFDLETTPAFGDPRSPLWRRNFSTSRFRSMQELAAEIANTPVRHRRFAHLGDLRNLSSGNPDPGSNPPVVPQPDQQLEQALHAIRWGELGQVARPRITVLWEDGAPPQPVAVLVEATEPLWRQRPIPKDQGASAPYRYAFEQQTWLDVFEPAALHHVTHFIRSSSGGRTLALLGPGSRGAVLELQLRQTPHQLYGEGTAATAAAVVKADLSRAPWEDFV